MNEIDVLIATGILLAQELQEFVDAAVEASNNENAMLSVQALVDEWEAAYRIAAGCAS